MSDHKIYMLQQIRECNKKLQERIDELDKRIKKNHGALFLDG